ncbi:MAG: deoxyribonuclease IV [bacterium]
MEKNIPLLGAHVSAAGGVSNAIDNGEALKCAAIQIFTKNQRQWFAPELKPEESGLFRQKWSKSGIKSIVSHSSYLINLASPDDVLREKSIDSFIDEINRSDNLGLTGVVFHPGSHVGAGESKGLANVIKSINLIIEKTAESKSKIILETTSGQGSSLGYKFEHLRDIIAGIENKNRMGVCIDTCHIFCAGYDIRTGEEYEKTVKLLDSIITLKNIIAIHFNDSKNDFGSGKDRHECVGKGLIGKKAFELFMNDNRFEDIPKILEIPGGDKAFKKDLRILRGLIR